MKDHDDSKNSYSEMVIVLLQNYYCLIYFSKYKYTINRTFVTILKNENMLNVLRDTTFSAKENTETPQS